MSHRLVVSIQGVVNDSLTVEASDSEALPLWVKLREVITEGRASGRRKARKDGETMCTDGPSPGVENASPSAGRGRGGDSD